MLSFYFYFFIHSSGWCFSVCAAAIDWWMASCRTFACIFRSSFFSFLFFQLIVPYFGSYMWSVLLNYIINLMICDRFLIGFLLPTKMGSKMRLNGSGGGAITKRRGKQNIILCCRRTHTSALAENRTKAKTYSKVSKKQTHIFSFEKLFSIDFPSCMCVCADLHFLACLELNLSTKHAKCSDIEMVWVNAKILLCVASIYFFPQKEREKERFMSVGNT